MIATIERTNAARYEARMRIAAIRLLTLAALLLMPFGMVSAPAAQAIHHDAAAAISADHCPDKQSSDDHIGSVAGCAMPCSSALPAADLSSLGAHPLTRGPAKPPLDQAPSQSELEIATPPPKLS